MKKILALLIVFCFAFSVTAWADPQPQFNLSVSATMEKPSPQMDIVILKIIDDNDKDLNPWKNNDGSDAQNVTGSRMLDFGKLTYLGNEVDPVTGKRQNLGVWAAPVAYCIVVFAEGFGVRYQITSTANITGLPNANTAFGLSTIYSDKDEFQWKDGTGSTVRDPQGAKQPGEDILYPSGTAMGSYFVFKSTRTPETRGRIIQLYYGIPPKKANGAIPFTGWTGIPLSQAVTGSFSGTVQITIGPA